MAPRASAKDSEERTDLTAEKRAPDTAFQIYVFHDGAAATFSLRDDATVTLGRSRECDVRVDIPSVSRKHALLRIQRGEVTVRDLDSSHGVTVDGSPLPRGSAIAVPRGAVLTMGDATVIVRSPTAAKGAALLPAGSAHAELDPGMARVHELVALVAPTPLRVILCGETGVGKEVLAAALHRLSLRAARPFIKLNCAAFPEALLESELFGHERGAFTGAVQAKQGLIEAADGGTLFLDELGEMPLATQAKLLRVLESAEILRVGSVKTKTVDVRFLCATNQDLAARIAEGAFRQDLFYRLNGISIVIPPLRERPVELRALVPKLLAEAAAKVGSAVPALADGVFARLAAHAWPGNIRELRNVLERALALSRGAEIGEQHLLLEPARASSPGVGKDAAPTRARKLAPDLERQRIVLALERCGGNQSEACAMLGMSRRTLTNRLNELGLPRPRKG